MRWFALSLLVAVVAVAVAAVAVVFPGVAAGGVEVVESSALAW